LIAAKAGLSGAAAVAQGGTVIRLIKRYGSRKLYDTEESRYVLLEDIAAWIRQGQEVRVIDNKTAEDVTAATLTQVISEEGRRGGFLPNEALHELIRAGASAVNTGVQKIQQGVDRFVQASIDRLAPLRQAREEMAALRGRLDELEASLVQAEMKQQAEPEPLVRPAVPTRKPGPRKARAVKRPRRSAAGKGGKA
jgi:polyhydroxyalkanoate synthesis repressor PhaR